MSRAFLTASSEYLQVDTAALTTVPITMACFFNVSNVTAQHSLIHLVNSGSINDWFLMEAAGAATGDPVRAFARRSTVANAETSTSFTANTWHHACAVFATASSRFAYLDAGGKVENTVTVTPSGLNRTAIGAARDSSPGSYCDGMIAEVGIWNVALDDAEIAALAKGVSPLLIRPQNLVTYVPLVRDADEDIVGGLSFTAGGTPTISAHPRIIMPSAQIIPFPPAAGASATLTGTITASVDESDIVAGGNTIILTLTGDTWVAAGTGPIGSTADTQAIIDGIDSAQAEGTGWDAVVKVGIDIADVVRTSSTVCTITLDAEATYDITAQETITATIPAVALVTSSSPVVASPAFTVDIAVSGRIMSSLTNHGGLAGFGGIAGRGGGLAG